MGGCGGTGNNHYEGLLPFKKKLWEALNQTQRATTILHAISLITKSLHTSGMSSDYLSYLMTSYLSASGGTVPWMMMISPGCMPPGMGPVYGIT